MFEYGIKNVNTNEEDIIFGYNPDDAFERANLNPREWFIWYTEFVD